MHFKDKKNTVYYALLVFILLAAFFLRYKGITFGFPLMIHADEKKIVNRAFKIIESGEMNPHFFNYPTGYIYTQAALLGMVDIAVKATSNPDGITSADKETLHFAGRFLTILLSMGTILIVYIIGTLLAGKTGGLAAAVFTAFSFLHVSNSFVVTVDSPMVFWCMLSFLMSLLIMEKGPKPKYYILAAVFAGFAVGTKYTAFIIVLPLLYAHFYSNFFSLRKSIDIKIISIMLLVVLAFLVTTPYALLDFGTFKKDILFESRHYSTRHIGADTGADSYKSYFLFLIDGFGIIPFIISIAGIGCLMVKDRKKGFFLLLFPLVFFLFIGRYKVHFARNLLAVIPFLSVFSGLLIAASIDIVKRHRKSRLKVLLFVGLAILSMAGLYGVYEQGYKAYRHVNRITLPDTRWKSTLWINGNLPPGSKIGLENYTPRPDRKLFTLSYLGICGFKRAPLKLGKFDYIVTSSKDYGRLFANKKKYAKQVALYNRIFKEFQLVKAFKPVPNHSTGPVIKILKVVKKHPRGVSL